MPDHLRPAGEELPEGADPNTPEADYADTGVNTRLLVYFGAAIGGGVIVVLIAVALLINLTSDSGSRVGDLNPHRSPLPQNVPPTFPAPQLQVNEPADLATVRREESAKINGYGWSNQQAGTARIPVSRAIDLIGGGQLPARPARQATPEPNANDWNSGQPRGTGR